MSKSRHIPTSISDAVKKAHYFECAWCGNALYDRHHIKEYALGGEHTLENLILVCPNCHRKVHDGDIDVDELRKRKSTHLQGDRIAGGFRTSLQSMKLLIGTNKFVLSDSSTVDIIRVGGVPFASIMKKHNTIFLKLRLYDKIGTMVFWMHDNIYWAPSHFHLECTKDYLSIKDKLNDRTCVKLEVKGDYFEMQFTNYIKDTVFHFDPTKILVGAQENPGLTITHGVIHAKGVECIFNY